MAKKEASATTAPPAKSNQHTKGIDKGKNIKDYKNTVFNEYPDLKGSVVVHHAIEQQMLKRQ